MLKHCVVRGKNVGFFDSGKPSERGECLPSKGTLLLLHCSGASHQIFQPLIEQLASHYRILAPDLLGYGASESWPENEPYQAQYDVDIVLQMLRIAGEPVHCLGYSFGGYLALEACLQAPLRIASLILAEPAAMHVLKNHPDESLWQNTQLMAQRCRESVASGDLKRAASIHLKFWGTPWMWLLAPRNLKNQLRKKLHKMVKEFLSLEVSGSPLDDYAAINTPCVLIVGEKSRPVAKAIIDLLEHVLPNSQSQWIEDVNHVTMFTHGAQILPAINLWLASQTRAAETAPVAQQVAAHDYAV